MYYHRARLSPRDFVGCGDDAIVNKPYTSHIYPYNQYHLGIEGSFNKKGYDHTFNFYASVNGHYFGVSSYPLQWAPHDWYIVVGVYDGSYLKLYVYGSLASNREYDPSIGRPIIDNEKWTLVGSKAFTGTLDSFDTNLFIGKQGNKNYSIPAEVDWVRIYSRALSNAEVTKLRGQ